MARLKDIANKANVSISTVSRVIHHDPSFSISLENRQKILQIAEELNYPISETPKANTKSKFEITGSIGLILLYNQMEEIEDPYYLSIRSNFKAECLLLGLSMKEYYYSEENTDLDLEEHSVIVVIGSGSFWSLQLREKIKKLNIPLIMVDFHHKSDGTSDFILIDWEKLMEKVINFILENGFTKIGFIGSQNIDSETHIFHQDAREKYFTKILKEKNLFDESYLFISQDTTINEGYNLAKKAIEQNKMPEAFFVENDTMALGVLKALKEGGIKVPEDVSIISCNDIPEAQYLSPSLTTIKIHTKTMGIMAARIAFERMVLKRNKGITVNIPVNLVVRESFLDKRGNK
ncbi:MAG: LacI family DNA-binding transcriptional regulator [Spirochaetia bacterium]|nr:LacI family DNA-binding transcriptional regulator [Spirochaetia bacterium]